MHENKHQSNHLLGCSRENCLWIFVRYCWIQGFRIDLRVSIEIKDQIGRLELWLCTIRRTANYGHRRWDLACKVSGYGGRWVGPHIKYVYQRAEKVHYPFPCNRVPKIRLKITKNQSSIDVPSVSPWLERVSIRTWSNLTPWPLPWLAKQSAFLLSRYC